MTLDIKNTASPGYLGHPEVVQALIENYIQEGLLGAKDPSMATMASYRMAQTFAGEIEGYTPISGWEKDLCKTLCYRLSIDATQSPKNILYTAFLDVAENVFKAVKFTDPEATDRRIRDIAAFLGHLLLGTVDLHYLPPYGSSHASEPHPITQQGISMQKEKPPTKAERSMFDCDEIPVPGISRRWLSRRSTLHEVQAKFMARLILEMETACIHAYQVRSSSELRFQMDVRPSPWDIPEVMRFIEGALACGFVCCDYNIKKWTDLEAVNSRPELTIGRMNHLEIRKYIHTVQRGDKWADGYGSPILESLASGALQLAANRLLNDESLYDPY